MLVLLVLNLGRRGGLRYAARTPPLAHFWRGGGGRGEEIRTQASEKKRAQMVNITHPPPPSLKNSVYIIFFFFVKLNSKRKDKHKLTKSQRTTSLKIIISKIYEK